MSTILQVLLIIWLTLSIVASILLVGKDREPITPGVAVLTFLINGAFVIALLMQNTGG